MAIDNSKLIQFYTGTALPANPIDNYVYFIANSGKGQLYKGSVLIGETNDNDAIASINAAIERINEDLATKATKDELAAHVVLYQTLVETVTGINSRLTTAEGEIDTLQADVSKNKTDIATNASSIATNAENIGKNASNISSLDGRLTIAESDIDKIEADYLKNADKIELEGQITTEKNRAEAAEKVNADNIASINDKLTGVTGTVIESINTAVNEEKTRAEDAEAELAADIKEISDDYLTSEDKSELQTAIETAVAAEETRAKGVEQGLDSRLTTAESDIVLLQANVDSLGNALHFRGAGTYAGLEALTNLKVGDVYVVIDPDHENDGKEYVYTESGWMEFGDVSDYATKTSLQAEINRATQAESGLAEDISDLEQIVADNKAAAEQAVAAEQSRATGIEEGLREDLDTLTGRVNAFDHILDEEGSVTQAIAKMSEELKKYADQAEADAITSSNEYTDSQISIVNGTINEIQANVDKKASQADFDVLKERVEVAEGEIDQLQIDLGSLTSRVGTAEGDIDTLESRMDAAEENINTNAANIALNVTDISVLSNALQWHQIV